MTLTIIIPCYNEQEMLPLFYQELQNMIYSISDVNFELLFVDDGSIDNTKEVIRSLSNKDENCKYIFLSRNFGKEAAIWAGLQHASGDYVVIMDADLQDPPSL